FDDEKELFSCKQPGLIEFARKPEKVLLIFNISKERFSCKTSNKSILQEKTENAIHFQMMRRNHFLANSRR
ncbi:MAG: hypothetical protein IJM24_03555, partial [Clostridia bacterium]|nr:hypothetical protein [Clostridia bacterium]